jgi:hypothetical protein
MSLTLRNVKGSPLTYTEMDNNLTYLEGLTSSTGSTAVFGSVSTDGLTLTTTPTTDTGNTLNILTIDSNGVVRKKQNKNVYKYKVLIGQAGTDAPYVNYVYEDDFGGLTWSRLAPGVYRLNGIPSAQFPVNYPNQRIIINGLATDTAVGNGYPVNTIISNGDTLGGYYKISTFWVGDGNSYVIIETFTSGFVATEWENVLGEILIDIEGYRL